MLIEKGKSLILIFSLLVFTQAASYSTDKTYQLIKQYPNSDIDYKFIRDIDSIPPPYPEASRYQIGDIKTIKGKFRVFKFISTYAKSSSQSQTENALFHDLLIIKTNEKNNIVDAYHYTLEWTDSPSLDLYKMQNKNVVLANGLSIKKLGLAIPDTGKMLNEEGKLAIK